MAHCVSTDLYMISTKNSRAGPNFEHLHIMINKSSVLSSYRMKLVLLLLLNNKSVIRYSVFGIL